MRRVVVAAGAAMAAAAAGCRPRGAAPAPRPAVAQLLSSEGSEYAPVLHAAVRVRLTADSVVVALDSGAVLAPGQPSPGLPAVMSGLRLTPVLAVARPPGGPPAGQPGARPGGTAWVALAEGVPAPIADSLYLAVPRPVGAVRWALARPTGLDPDATYLVLRVTGDATEIAGRASDGRVLVERSRRLSIRVYACAATALDGRPDAGRGAALAAAYTAAC